MKNIFDFRLTHRERKRERRVSFIIVFRMSHAVEVCQRCHYDSFPKAIFFLFQFTAYCH